MYYFFTPYKYVPILYRILYFVLPKMNKKRTTFYKSSAIDYKVIIKTLLFTQR